MTVPSHFNQAERNSVKEAVHIGGLNLLQLMSVNAAGIYPDIFFSNFTDNQQYLFLIYFVTSYCKALFLANLICSYIIILPMSLSLMIDFVNYSENNSLCLFLLRIMASHPK